VLSATKVRVLAPWQEKLTLGPGDTFDISLYGHPETARPTTIAPDGRINYLEAKDFEASGLTIDELRVKLEGVLAQYHLAPRAVIVPTAFVSKKYFVLGSVNGRGVYPLDRPTTVIEAIARARGFVTAGPLRNPGSAVDFAHAFLVRRDPDGSFHREPIDFEGLFSRGELQHNRLLAPGDYLYFPPAGLQEIYVFGEVALPGVLPFTTDLSVIRAIAARGGYTEAAFRQKILVVRGSLQSPETFSIDSAKVLRGTTTDFALQPGDIVYVSRKPWAKAEEILQAAASDFARAAVTGWTGETIGVIR
jgi:polysaccharide export outer membrane protein